MLRRLSYPLLAVALCACSRPEPPAPLPPAPPTPVPAAAPDGWADTPAVAAILAERRRRDETTWAGERRAQQVGAEIVALWDALRAAPAAAAVVTGLGIETLHLGTLGPASTGRPPRVRPVRPGGATLEGDAWRSWVREREREGWRLVHTEWHHVAFAPKELTSTVEAVLHLRSPQADTPVRVVVDLKVAWRAATDDAFDPRTVTVTGGAWTSWPDPPRFEVGVLASAGSAALADPPPTTPILAHDLDGDGLSEILLPRQAVLLRNRGGGRLEPEPLLPGDPTALATSVRGAVVADLTGDGAPDLLLARAEAPPALAVGGGRRGFEAPRPLEIRGSDVRWDNPEAVTAGDIDGDGDLDLFLAQYMPAYTEGRMPVPYHDANDGWRAALLRNDGGGRFTDITEAAGLAPKRRRRTYGASLVDLDGDGDLDLVTSNDFAGPDLHRNDGHGRFRDATGSLVQPRGTFGMGHVLDDLDGDGQVDLFVTGMSSSTARRLSSMDLGYASPPSYAAHRPSMGYGNRLFLAGPHRSFTQPDWADTVARSGWSWGAASLDVDNDGRRDLYLANGNLSGASASDYCSTFWTHDIYATGTEPDDAAREVFVLSQVPLGQRETSWNGYEHNHLYLARGARGFVEAAFPLGVAFEYDARAVLADDLDRDGRVDLLVTRRPGGPDGHHVHALRNAWPAGPDARWIGVDVLPAPGRSPIGARVEVATPNGRHVALIATGEGFRTQRATSRHFGLGAIDRVEAVTVTWPDGHTRSLTAPAVDRYHRVRP